MSENKEKIESLIAQLDGTERGEQLKSSMENANSIENDAARESFYSLLLKSNDQAEQIDSQNEKIEDLENHVSTFMGEKNKGLHVIGDYFNKKKEELHLQRKNEIENFKKNGFSPEGYESIEEMVDDHYYNEKFKEIDNEIKESSLNPNAVLVQIKTEELKKNYDKEYTNLMENTSSFVNQLVVENGNSVMNDGTIKKVYEELGDKVNEMNFNLKVNLKATELGVDRSVVLNHQLIEEPKPINFVENINENEQKKEKKKLFANMKENVKEMFKKDKDMVEKKKWYQSKTAVIGLAVVGLGPIIGVAGAAVYGAAKGVAFVKEQAAKTTIKLDGISKSVYSKASEKKKEMEVKTLKKNRLLAKAGITKANQKSYFAALSSNLTGELKHKITKFVDEKLVNNYEKVKNKNMEFNKKTLTNQNVKTNENTNTL